MTQSKNAFNAMILHHKNKNPPTATDTINWLIPKYVSKRVTLEGVTHGDERTLDVHQNEALDARKRQHERINGRQRQILFLPLGTHYKMV